MKTIKEIIEKVLKNRKSISFSSEKAKTSFVNSLEKELLSYLETREQAKDDSSKPVSTFREKCIVHPNPKGKGDPHKVMTAGESTKLDEARKTRLSKRSGNIW